MLEDLNCKYNHSVCVECLDDITNDNNTVYAVTDKADGSRYLMYISSPILNMRDNVFFLDKFNNIYRPGIYTDNTSLYNTILDGEFIDYKNIFLIFSIFFNIYQCFINFCCSD